MATLPSSRTLLTFPKQSPHFLTAIILPMRQHQAKPLPPPPPFSLSLSEKDMAMKNANRLERRVTCKGAWTAEEDRRLAEFIETHGAKKWETVAIKAGLNRCGKSCRLRWLNYLRPNIKRGNISDEEEDLILRLHRLLGNRWSLIAGRLPGRTDNEIKNYWNSHLSKKAQQMEKITKTSAQHQSTPQLRWEFAEVSDECEKENENSDTIFDIKEFFNFSSEGDDEMEWVKFLEDPLLYGGDGQSNENITS